MTFRLLRDVAKFSPEIIEARDRIGNQSSLELAPNLQMALLTLRRSEQSKAVIAKLKEQGEPAAVARDYYELQKLQLAYRKPDNWHALTPRGQHSANDIASKRCRELNIHIIKTYSEFYQGHSYKCTCGWSASEPSARWQSGIASLEKAARRHLDDPEAHAITQMRVDALIEDFQRSLGVVPKDPDDE